MPSPDTQLCQIYGTTKEATDMATAARIAAAVLSLGLASSDSSHVEEERERQQQEIDERRALEAERMSAMIGAMKSASVAGQILARAVPASEFEKAAFGAFMGKAVGALAGGAGRLVGAVPGGKAVVGALTPGWKTKALAIGGTAATGYAGYKGLSALRDYASSAPGGDELWGAKRPIKHNINEWGYPES